MLRPAGKRPTTIFVVDDHQTFVGLLKVAIDLEADLEWVGSATNVDAALASMSGGVPDLVVMDYQLADGDGDGVHATAVLTKLYPAMRVVILTGYPHEALIHMAAAAGACALVPKSGRLSDLLDCLRSATPNGFTVHPTLLKSLMSGGARRPLPKLSPRETEVLRLLARGYDLRSIAADLGISTSTSRGYVQTVLEKLDAHSRLEAVAVANRLGLTDAADLPSPA
jgi:two-component system, NarL family, nitrate/nitrite response regulator NarL